VTVQQKLWADPMGQASPSAGVETMGTNAHSYA
jgi:hypothetical protein